MNESEKMCAVVIPEILFDPLPDEDIESFLLQLTKDQFDKIENFFTSSPKIVQLIESKCNHCGHENTSRIEGLQNFFV